MFSYKLIQVERHALAQMNGDTCTRNYNIRSLIVPEFVTVAVSQVFLSSVCNEPWKQGFWNSFSKRICKLV